MEGEKALRRSLAVFATSLAIYKMILKGANEIFFRCHIFLPMASVILTIAALLEKCGSKV